MGGLARRHIGPIFLAASKPFSLAEDEGHDMLKIIPPPRWPTLGPLWLNTTVSRLARGLELDLWIGSLAILPLNCPVPTAAMVHDLTPLSHPTRHTMANRLVFRFFFERSLKIADRVVVGSRATADELVGTYGWVEPKLELIGYGVEEWYSPAGPEDDGMAIRRRFSNGRPYVLHLGTIEPRKGVPDLIAAWEKISREMTDPPDLVIAGKLGWRTEPILRRIRRSSMSDRIHLPGYVNRADARELLRHAAVFALASEVEGFGLPLAEAISCGTPAVAAGIPALREAAGDAAVFYQPGNHASLAAALSRALAPDTAADLRSRALKRAPALRWGPIVDDWSELLRKIAAG
jgi:glycosyltransferase involved in cell wall biosynthesis